MYDWFPCRKPHSVFGGFLERESLEWKPHCCSVLERDLFGGGCVGWEWGFQTVSRLRNIMSNNIRKLEATSICFTPSPSHIK